MTPRLHHLNLLVADLDRAVEDWRTLLGDVSFELEELPQRGVRTARTPLGETWLVLVQPTDPDGLPGRHLDRHGEGLFLVSLATSDLAATRQRLDAAGIPLGPVRTGLSDWRVADVGDGLAGHSLVQFCED